MKVLSLYYTHKPGGFCKRLYMLLNALGAAGHEVWYLSLDAPPGGLSDSVNFRRIPFFTSKRNGLFFWGCFTLWCPVYVLYAALYLKPDRYAVFGAYYASMLFFARIFCRRPLVLFLRSLVFKIDAITGKSWWVRSISAIVERRGMLSADKVVCMTESMRSDAERFAGKRFGSVSILPNNLPECKKNQGKIARNALLNGVTAGDEFLVLASGVIDQRKNLRLLIEAVKGAEVSERNIILLIAGDGPLLKLYRKHVDTEQIKNVKFLGWRDDLGQICRAVDLVVHPSLHEGMSNSVLEALAADVPVLLSDIREHREVISFPEALFDPSDPEDLRKRILELAKSSESLKRLKDRCKVESKKLHFDWGNRAAQIIHKV